MNTQTTSSGIGIGSLLGIVFIVLKLTGVINWSWWWVTCPLWAGFAIFLMVVLVVSAIAIIAGIFSLIPPN